MVAWTPRLPSTTWVIPKSTPTESSEIAASSLKPQPRHQQPPRLAESIAHRRIQRGFFVHLAQRRLAQLRQIIRMAEALHDPGILGLDQRVGQVLEQPCAWPRRCSFSLNVPVSEHSMAVPDTSPSPCEACGSPTESNAPATATGR